MNPGFIFVMRSVISSLTAVSVLLHVVLGCCAHHGHAHERPATEPTKTACAQHGCSSDAHAQGTLPADSKENEPPADQHQDDCEQADCAFTATVEKAETLAKASPGAWLLPHVAIAEPSCQRWSGQCVSRHDPPEGPVRAHLLYGVLLN